MPRGQVRECYMHANSGIYDQPECAGRRRLVIFDGEEEKQWVCKACHDVMKETTYCNGGFLLCYDPIDGYCDKSCLGG